MPDGSYNYRGTVGQRMGRVFLRTLVKLFAPLITFCVCGARVVGRKNLKGLKGGAVSICNHIHYLDTFFIRRAVGAFRSYHTMGPWNNRKDFVGFIMRRGAMLPLTANLAGMRNLNVELERLVTKKKQIINFYPEQAFWKNYQKPRPMMDGAFHYAVKFNVPVVPIFCTFKKKKGKPKKLRIAHCRLEGARAGGLEAVLRKCVRHSAGVFDEGIKRESKNEGALMNTYYVKLHLKRGISHDDCINLFLD